MTIDDFRAELVGLEFTDAPLVNSDWAYLRTFKGDLELSVFGFSEMATVVIQNPKEYEEVCPLYRGDCLWKVLAIICCMVGVCVTRELLWRDE